MLHSENLSYYAPNTPIVAVVEIRLHVKPDFELTQRIFLAWVAFSVPYIQGLRLYVNIIISNL